MAKSQSVSSSSKQPPEELPCVRFNYKTYGLDRDGQPPPSNLFHCDLIFDDSKCVQASCYCANPKLKDDERMIIVSEIRSEFLLEHICGMDSSTSYHFTPKMDHMTFLGFFEDLFFRFKTARRLYWMEYVWMPLQVVASGILKGIHDLFTHGFNHTLLCDGIAINCGNGSLPTPKLFNFELTRRSPKDPEFISMLILDLTALQDLVYQVFCMKGSLEMIEPYHSQLNLYLSVDFSRCDGTNCTLFPDFIVEPIMTTKIFDPFFWNVTDNMLFMKKMDHIFGKYPKMEASIKQGMGDTLKWIHLHMGVFKESFYWDPNPLPTSTQRGPSAPLPTSIQRGPNASPSIATQAPPPQPTRYQNGVKSNCRFYRNLMEHPPDSCTSTFGTKMTSAEIDSAFQALFPQTISYIRDGLINSIINSALNYKSLNHAAVGDRHIRKKLAMLKYLLPTNPYDVNF